MLRCVGNPRGALSIHISCKALSGASLEIRIRECAALIVFGGRHSRHGRERRPHSFLWVRSRAKKGMKYMDAVLSRIGGLLKVLWKITKFLCKPAWEGLKDLWKILWELYKEWRAKKAASASESAAVATDPSGSPNDTDLESSGTNS